MSKVMLDPASARKRRSDDCRDCQRNFRERVLKQVSKEIEKEIRSFNALCRGEDKKYAVEGVEESKYFTQHWITREHTLDVVRRVLGGKNEK